MFGPSKEYKELQHKYTLLQDELRESERRLAARVKEIEDALRKKSVYVVTLAGGEELKIEADNAKLDANNRTLIMQNEKSYYSPISGWNQEVVVVAMFPAWEKVVRDGAGKQ